MRPGDCSNCGWGEFAHDCKTGTCLWGGEGEDATGYERLGVAGMLRSAWRNWMWSVTQFGPQYKNVYQVTDFDAEGEKWLKANAATP